MTRPILALLLLPLLLSLACITTLPPLAPPSPMSTSVPVAQTESPTFVPTTLKSERVCLVVVADESLYIRELPTMNSEAIAWVKNGDKIELIFKSQGWWFVDTGTVTGYVYSKYVGKCTSDIGP